ncbi:MAG: hypothetical protein A2622_03665 [Bdellovibrionales bacterium RIFCSPHIGHO2_01_FULL_40_29]|nr:MAG: hypothetical protein A2622_03665 [Bdellovibrionales bacterium RIFCSPHIGHO2_01_FULL_40_29]OFZ35383.1 MAG: hypothetical protein A3D17_08365 [Bdellovibrionales bacterium RIFCSPHIGHO2_02_FULL_40_15]
MKKLLVIAVALASVNAFGSRARMTALGSSPHLVDTQTVYTNPSDMFYVGGDYVTVESGLTTTATQNANAEGMVVRSMGDAKMGLSLGHQSTNASDWGLRSFAPNLTGPANANQQNPLELSYGMKTGDMAWGGTLVYSNYNDKVNDEKESSTGARFGMRMGAIDFSVGLGLVNTVDTAATKYKGTIGLSGNVGYTMENMYAFAGVTNAGAKLENAAGTELANFTRMDIQAGVVSSNKKDGNEFFYGAKLFSRADKETIADTKTTILNLPIWMGLEVEASSWMAFRGSLTQNLVLLDNTKTETAGTATTETAPGANSTTAAFGAGLKFNKLTVDGTILATGLQTYSATALLSQVGVTYMF